MAVRNDNDNSYVEISSCIAGPGVNLDLGVDSLYEGCSCHGRCKYDAGSQSANNGHCCTCTCAYTADSCLSSFYLLQNSPPVFECNSRCKCDHDCPNRVSQNGSCEFLRLFQTQNKGLGVKTLHHLVSGSFIAEYVGEIVSNSMANVRLQSQEKSSSCYVLKFREHLSDNQVIATNIDATCKGNIARFINHSCDPNLVVIPIRTDSLIPRLCLFTCRHVNAEEELCFSYFGNNDTISVGSKRCLCGSPNCIGFLPFYDQML